MWNITIIILLFVFWVHFLHIAKKRYQLLSQDHLVIFFSLFLQKSNFLGMDIITVLPLRTPVVVVEVVVTVILSRFFAPPLKVVIGLVTLHCFHQLHSAENLKEIYKSPAMSVVWGRWIPLSWTSDQWWKLNRFLLVPLEFCNLFFIVPLHCSCQLTLTRGNLTPLPFYQKIHSEYSGSKSIIPIKSQ